MRACPPRPIGPEYGPRAWGSRSHCRLARAGAAAALAVAAGLASLVHAGSAEAPDGAIRQERPSNRACQECHGQAHLAELLPRDRLLMVAGPAPTEALPEEPRPGLLVNHADFEGTRHAELSCTDCHRDAVRLPHARVLAPASCNFECHQDAGLAFASSVHAASLFAGDPQAPRCQTCHGGHRILPKSSRESTVHPLNAARICGDCHVQHTTPTSNGESAQELVAEYLDSVHGRGVTASGLTMAATCADCHGHHDVLATADPLARTARAQIPDTCGRCHLGVEETYARSIHGQALAADDPLAPVCTDCHTGHEITRASTPETHLDIVAECGDCHDRPEMSRGRRATFYRTYRASYHGQVTRLGSTRAARCSDCHGAHDILPLDNPGSRLHGENLVETCRSCHPRANANFALFDPHADYRDRELYPLLHGVWLYFIIVMSLAFGFFGLHSILWFLRSLLERRKAPPPAHRSAPAIRRFTRLNRLNHLLVIVTFLGLVLTGIPLLFSDQAWARQIAVLMGGVSSAGTWHRALAILLGLNFAIHFFSVVRSFREYDRPKRDWLIGPDSMVPRWKDVQDCAAMIRWFFRGGPTPHFGRWTYWEKFDYWAEIGGSGIIGVSGLLLWFPEFFASFLPGWIFNVAMIIHGYEALLALGFIFTIHFFNAHLRVDKFPVDDVIFTGSLSEEEFRHERPEEYERLVASGHIEALRVPVPPRWQRQFAVVVGVLAMAIGITLVVLIILAGLGRL